MYPSATLQLKLNNIEDIILKKGYVVPVFKNIPNSNIQMKFTNSLQQHLRNWEAKELISASI